MSPQASTTSAPEVIGNFSVHPAAARFPPLSQERFVELKESLKTHGQQVPIIAQGNTLLDGRNRLQALLELGVEPKVEQFTGTATEQIELIYRLNLIRRDLTENQRTAIGVDLMHMIAKEEAAARQKTGKNADGSAGGRGRKKNLTPKSGEGLSGRHARETASIAAKALGVSRYAVEQATEVMKHDPELFEKLMGGTVKLKDAHAKVKAAKAAKSSQPLGGKPGFLDVVEARLIHRLRHVMDTYPSAYAGLRKKIIEAMDQWAAKRAVQAVHEQRSEEATANLEALKRIEEETPPGGNRACRPYVKAGGDDERAGKSTGVSL